MRWAPSTGVLLLLMTVAALGISNSPIGPSFLALWEATIGVRLGESELSLSVLDWINHGLLTIFFLVVGLEIKGVTALGEAPRSCRPWRP